MNSHNHYISEEDYDKEFSINEYSNLGYYSKKAMKQRYPKGGFVVLGGIGYEAKKAKGTFVYNEQEMPYYALRRYRFCYGVKGYIALGHNQYLAIVKNTIIKNTCLTLIGIGVLMSLVFVLSQVLPESGIDREARDYTPPEGVNIKTDPNHISLPGYDIIQMDADSDIAYLALWNPPDNPCYFKFKIELEGSNEQIYESELVPPGKAVTKVKMNQTFPQGEYGINIHILTYSLEDKEKEMNGGTVVAKLVAMK